MSLKNFEAERRAQKRLMELWVEATSPEFMARRAARKNRTRKHITPVERRRNFVVKEGLNET